ncbi:TIGR04283 family arsenosugar biosynthesis glycosyltransferase [soil metagenome]
MVSIIIPTFNEEKQIPLLMNNLLSQNSECEIIIVDGGSTDLTLSKCLIYKNVKIISSEKGRANQMNKGAEAAKGEILLFLHADTLLPENGIEAIEEAMKDTSYIGGSFFMKFDKDSLPLRFYSSFTKINNSYFTYGDQGIFVRKNIFKEIDGYKITPILEDFEIQKRLRKKGKFIKLPLAVTTSSRRFVQVGEFKQQIINIALLGAYELGVSPQNIKKYYSDLSR